MSHVAQYRIVARLVAVAALTLSLLSLVREDSQAVLDITRLQIEAPLVVALNHPNSPLVISAERQLPKTEQAPEVAFNVTNVTNKTITAFAIKLEVASGLQLVSTVSLYNLELSATELPPNHSLSKFDVYENLSSSQHRVTLSVDYVQFSDGPTWGPDSANSAERVAGQHAAIETLTTRLTGIIRVTNPNDLANILESMVNIEPPPQHSENWNYGFRVATRSFANRLKRANQAGGLGQVNTELSRFATKRTGP